MLSTYDLGVHKAKGVIDDDPLQSNDNPSIG